MVRESYVVRRGGVTVTPCIAEGQSEKRIPPRQFLLGSRIARHGLGGMRGVATVELLGFR